MLNLIPMPDNATFFIIVAFVMFFIAEVSLGWLSVFIANKLKARDKEEREGKAIGIFIGINLGALLLYYVISVMETTG